MPKPVLLITLLGHFPLGTLRGNLYYGSHRFSIHSTLALCNQQEVDLKASEPPPPLAQPTSSASLQPLLPSLSSSSCSSFSGITYLGSTGFIFSQPVLFFKRPPLPGVPCPSFPPEKLPFIPLLLTNCTPTSSIQNRMSHSLGKGRLAMRRELLGSAGRGFKLHSWDFTSQRLSFSIYK